MATAIEPRAAIERYEFDSGTFDLLLSGRSVHEICDQLADNVHNALRDTVHLAAPDLSGGFGPKNVVHPE